MNYCPSPGCAITTAEPQNFRVIKIFKQKTPRLGGVCDVYISSMRLVATFLQLYRFHASQYAQP